MNRLVVFADPRHLAARILLPALLEAAAQRVDMNFAALLVPEFDSGWRSTLRWRREQLLRRLQSLLGSGVWERSLEIGPLSLTHLAQRYGVKVIPIPRGDPNDPDVLGLLGAEPRYDLAVNLYCIKPFRKELLRCFEMIVNYHNGSLPAFRGLRATNWSIYIGSTTSGYAFHRMDADLDTGDVLLSGNVPVDHRETPADLELHKALAAARRLPELFDALSKREPGRPQSGIACSHNRRAYELVTHVADPSALSREEWERRLRAFLRIVTCLHGRWWPVTRVVPCKSGERLAFRSADGQWLKVACVDFWPSWFSRGNRNEP